MTENLIDANLAVEAARDALSVGRVFGEAYEVDGTTVIPVAKVLGGGGHGFGSGSTPELARSDASAGSAEGSGGGGGFGVRVRPIGAYVISGGQVTWRPALDLNRVILGGQVTVALVTLAAACVLRTRRRRRR